MALSFSEGVDLARHDGDRKGTNRLPTNTTRPPLAFGWRRGALGGAWLGRAAGWRAAVGDIYTNRATRGFRSARSRRRRTTATSTTSRRAPSTRASRSRTFRRSRPTASQGASSACISSPLILVAPFSAASSSLRGGLHFIWGSGSLAGVRRRANSRRRSTDRPHNMRVPPETTPAGTGSARWGSDDDEGTRFAAVLLRPNPCQRPPNP